MKDWLLASFVKKNDRLEKFVTTHHFDAPSFAARGHDVGVLFSFWTVVVGLVIAGTFAVGSPYMTTYLALWFGGYLLTMFYGLEQESRSAGATSTNSPHSRSNGFSNKKEM